MPVMIIWTRGQSKAKTKRKLLTDKSNTADFDEKFQINTTLEVDTDGKPTKSKMSVLTVASSKEIGILGKCDLDLTNYGSDEFNMLKLPLIDCKYENAFIEVGLKGVIKARTSASRVSTPTGGLQGSNLLGGDASNPSAAASSSGNATDHDSSQLNISVCIDEYDKHKKEKRQAEIEANKTIQQLNQQNN